MDAEEAAWLAEQIRAAISDILSRPGLTIEVDDRPDLWLQIIPETNPTGTTRHSGYMLNFPPRVLADSVRSSMSSLAGIRLPPRSQLVAFEPGSYATVWIDPGIDLHVLAQLCGDILVNLVGARPQASINIQIEHGL